MTGTVNPPRGFKDLGPVESELKHRMIARLQKVYESWGFLKVETPNLENIERLKQSDGGENTQMIFEVLKRGAKLQEAVDNKENASLSDLGLRYDLTVPLSRFIASNQASLPKHFKLVQFGSVFRAERPQKGRYRQFTQWDADIFGYGAPNAEIELVCCTAEALCSLGLRDFIVRVNDRRILDSLMTSCGIVEEQDKSKCLISIDKLDKIGIDGVEADLRSFLTSTSSVEKIVSALRPFVGKDRCTSIEEGLQRLELELDFDWKSEIGKVIEVPLTQSKSRYSVIFDPSLVRGLGYYTAQIFEIEYKDYPFSIAGGGRYDNILEKFGKQPISGCGFSLGFDRILYVLENEGIDLTVPDERRLLVLSGGDIDQQLLDEVARLRKEFNVVSTINMARNNKKTISDYAKLGYTHSVSVSEGGFGEIKKISNV